MRAVAAGQLERFRDLLTRRFGLRFDETKRVELAGLLERRAAAAGRSVDDYLTACETADLNGEAGALAEALTVPETYFFRDVAQLRALTDVVIPERLRVQAQTRRLRILSAGCASGEEAYSVALLIRDSVDPSWDVSILGVDLNPAMVKKARQARYSRWALRETSEAVRDRWFRADGRNYVLDPAVRANVRFDVVNLVETDGPLWLPESYDIVLCRNVLMYFAPEQARAVVDRLTRSLKAGGYLFLGYAETLRGVSRAYRVQHTHGTFYYQRHDRDAAAAVAAEAIESSPVTDGTVSGAASTHWMEAIGRASARVEALATSPRRQAGEGRRARRTATGTVCDLSVGLDLLRDERFAEASEFLRNLPPESAGDRAVLLLNAVLCTQAGWLVAAEEACERLLAADESSAPAYYLLALCREGAGDRAAAARHDHIAAYLDGTFAMPRLHLGLLARRAGDEAAARRELELALTLLNSEDESRLQLFGSGFGRAALVALCRSELEACGVRS